VVGCTEGGLRRREEKDEEEDWHEKDEGRLSNNGHLPHHQPLSTCCFVSSITSHT
jgi:hypothetical protein